MRPRMGVPYAGDTGPIAASEPERADDREGSPLQAAPRPPARGPESPAPRPARVVTRVGRCRYREDFRTRPHVTCPYPYSEEGSAEPTVLTRA